MMLLTPADLIELTDCQRAHEQRAWLDARGWIYEVSRLGTVKVLRRYAEMRMGIPLATESTQSEPDFSAFGGRA